MNTHGLPYYFEIEDRFCHLVEDLTSVDMCNLDAKKLPMHCYWRYISCNDEIISKEIKQINCDGRGNKFIQDIKLHNFSESRNKNHTFSYSD